MTRIKLTVVDDSISPLLDKIVTNLRSREILDDAGTIMLNLIKRRFLQQVDENNTSWVPSFASIQRRRKGRGGGTLFDSGRLFRSIQLARTSKNVAAIQTNVPYAGAHQFGEGQVRRPFLNASEADVGVLSRFILNRMLGAL